MAPDYQPKMPLGWWLKRRAYLLYVLRELTAVFLGAYCVVLLYGLAQLRQGQEAWFEFVALLETPASLLFHAVALVFAVYHSLTWFALTPKVMVVRLGEERLPGALIAGGHYALWIVVSVGFVWWIARYLVP